MGGFQGFGGPDRLPRSITSKPWLRSASPRPATRRASGPIPAPRVLAPTSVGAPMRLTVVMRVLAAGIVSQAAGQPGRLLQDASAAPMAAFASGEWAAPDT